MILVLSLSKMKDHSTVFGFLVAGYVKINIISTLYFCSGKQIKPFEYDGWIYYDEALIHYTDMALAAGRVCLLVPIQDGWRRL